RRQRGTARPLRDPPRCAAARRDPRGASSANARPGAQVDIAPAGIRDRSATRRDRAAPGVNAPAADIDRAGIRLAGAPRLRFPDTDRAIVAGIIVHASMDAPGRRDHLALKCCLPLRGAGWAATGGAREKILQSLGIVGLQAHTDVVPAHPPADPRDILAER